MTKRLLLAATAAALLASVPAQAALKEGARVPSLVTQGALAGKTFNFNLQQELRKGPVVLYFFPKAFTPGCTVEAQLFRDNHAEIALAGASIVGVSTDGQKTQCRFAEAHKVPYPMIADRDRGVCRAYDVLWPIVGIARRITYVISPAMEIAAVFHQELQARKHRHDVRAFIHARFRAARPPAV